MVSTTRITIGGAGGIGSFLCQWLARQHPSSISIYDFDLFEMVNAGSQFMVTDNINMNKAEVAASHAINFSNYLKIIPLFEFEKDSEVEPFCFAGFDKILPRKFMFEQWLKLKDKKMFIDGRLLAESFEIFVITDKTPESVDKYRKHLFDDSEVPELPCTMKATSHAGAMIASMMTGLFNNYLTNEVYDEWVRDIPFHILFDIPLFNLQILDK